MPAPPPPGGFPRMKHAFNAAMPMACTVSRGITFIFGNFTHIKALFPVALTDFPQLVHVKSWKNCEKVYKAMKGLLPLVHVTLGFANSRVRYVPFRNWALFDTSHGRCYILQTITYISLMPTIKEYFTEFPVLLRLPLRRCKFWTLPISSELSKLM